MVSRSKIEIFLFVPNLIGYLRLLLIFVSWMHIENPGYFLPMYLLSVILDAVDGYAARKLNQISDFGACLDVIVDLIGRGMVWTNVSKYGYAVIAMEWIVFVGNNERAAGSQWKKSFDSAPLFVRTVMKNGFKTPLGMFTVVGLHMLPPWLYTVQAELLQFSPHSVTNMITYFLISGRILCGSVELWCLWYYIQVLLSKAPYVQPDD